MRHCGTVFSSFSPSIQPRLSISERRPMNLGIAFPDEQTIATTASLTMTLEIGVRSSGEEVSEEDFFFDVSTATATVSASKTAFQRRTSTSVLSAQQSTAVRQHCPQRSISICKPIPAVLPLSVSTALQSALITDSLLADTPPSDVQLNHDVSFMLRIGNGDSREVRLSAAATGTNDDLDDLISDLQTAINDAGFQRAD